MHRSDRAGVKAQASRTHGSRRERGGRLVVFFAAAAALWLAAVQAFPDEVVLGNGHLISGRIESLGDGEFLVE